MDEFLKRHGADGETWIEWQAPCAVSAEATYLSESFVMQRRPLHSFDSFKRRLDFLHQQDSPFFKAAPIDLVREAAQPFFVTLARRVDDPAKSPAHLDLAGDELWSHFDSSYRDVLQAISILNALQAAESLVTLKRGYISAAKVASNHYLNELLEISGFRLRIPEPPRSDLVISHGDPLLKNTIISKDDGSYLLIDWGELGLFPRYSDPAHALGWMLMRTAPELWDSKLDDYLPEFAEVMGLNSFLARQMVFESVVRDLVLYRDRTWLESLEADVHLQLTRSRQTS